MLGVVQDARDPNTQERSAQRTFIEGSTSEDDRALLDEHTWDDLDMDAVADRLDRSVSLIGRMALRRLLRTPTTSGATLAERERLLGVFERDPHVGPALRKELARAHRAVNADDLVGLLWGEPPAPSPLAWVYAGLALVACLSLPLALSLGKMWILTPAVAFGLNAGVHFRARARWQPELTVLRFAGAMVAAARRLAALRLEGIEGHQHRLAVAVRKARPLTRQLAWLSAGGVQDMLYEYFNIFFLLEQRALQRILVRLPGVIPALRETFLVLGELDALQGVALWRAENHAWCRPELDEDAPGLEIEDGVHPVLEHAVPNSITLTVRGALITGANMSGKSTFLRVVGINAVLAQTVGTCRARRFRSSRLCVRSSMRVADDVVRGKSRYLAEAERLLALVRQAGTTPRALCLIDELLSGTNAAERLAASAAILSYLERAGSLVVAATHDLELAHHLRDSYDAYFFADDFSADDVRFDHRIHAGLATTRNAIQLLERLGFPPQLVASARSAVAREPTS
jgi:hypothetical protein